MARKNEFGRYILSAGEIGAYSVCPEAWRLRSVVKTRATYENSKDLGKDLHREWLKNFDDAVYLRRGVRLLVSMLFLIVLSTLLF